MSRVAIENFGSYEDLGVVGLGRRRRGEGPWDRAQLLACMRTGMRTLCAQQPLLHHASTSSRSHTPLCCDSGAHRSGPSSWLGPLPRQLLDGYVAAHPPPPCAGGGAGAATVAEMEAAAQYRAAVGATVQIDLEVGGRVCVYIYKGNSKRGRARVCVYMCVYVCGWV